MFNQYELSLSSFSIFSMGRRRCVRTAWTLTSRTSTSPSWTPVTSTVSTASASSSGATISRQMCRRPPSTTVRQMSSSRWAFHAKRQFACAAELMLLCQFENAAGIFSLQPLFMTRSSYLQMTWLDDQFETKVFGSYWVDLLPVSL